MTRAARWGAAFIGAWAVLALSAPLLPLRDPAAQPDGLVLRTLPPGSRAWEVILPDGTTRYAEEVAAGSMRR